MAAIHTRQLLSAALWREMNALSTNCGAWHGGNRRQRKTWLTAKTAPTVSYCLAGSPEGAGGFRTHPHTIARGGHGITRNHKGADLVIVNTCGFPDPARQILAPSVRRWRRTARSSSPSRMGAATDPDLLERFPDVFAITGPQQYETVVAAVHEAARRPTIPMSILCRAGPQAPPAPTTPIEISEGCNIAARSASSEIARRSVSRPGRPTSCAKPRGR